MPKPFTNEDFIQKARSIHGDDFEYLEPYRGMKSLIRARCLKHNVEFPLKPHNHLYNESGCPQCGTDNKSAGNRTPQSEIIEMAKKVHSDCDYEYSIAKFRNIGEDTEIICHRKDVEGNEHGIFRQSMRNHIYAKQGCPKCFHDAQRRPIFGIGINDINIDTNSMVYIKWFQMFNRCYGGRNRTYEDCTVCEEWHYLSNFKKWFENPENGYQEGYHLDKDLLVKGNREYAPDKCCFLPSEINGHFKQFKKNSTGLPRGVQMRKGKYVVAISENGKPKHIGTFRTPTEAFFAFKQSQENKYRRMAKEYFKKGKITKKVYDALMRYEVEPDD